MNTVAVVNQLQCYGNAGLSIQMSVLNACGLRAAACPTAIISNPYEGYNEWTYQSGYMPEIIHEWTKNGIQMDAMLVGKLFSYPDSSAILRYKERHEGMMLITDPHIGDNGTKYRECRTQAYLDRMVELCSNSDIILPNYTEACLLTGMEFMPEPDDAFLHELTNSLSKICSRFVIKGIRFNCGEIAIIIYDRGMTNIYRHATMPWDYNGSGDFWAAVFTGYMLRGQGMMQSAVSAASFTIDAVCRSMNAGKQYRDGLDFEQDLRRYYWKLNN